MIPLVALIIVVLCGAIGLALDGGRLFLEKRQLQAAADAGALGGAHELWRNHNDSMGRVVPAIHRDAGLNGASSSNGATITFNRPPTQGSQAGNSRFVEVLIERTVPTTFTRVIGPQGAVVRVRSVAGLVPAVENCILALHPTAPAALRIRGSADLDMSCGAQSNSTNSCALQIEGSADISATSLGSSGGYCQLGGPMVSPQPVVDVPPALDPLAHLDPPNYGGWPEGFYDSDARIYRCPGGQCVWPNRINIEGPANNKSFESGIHVLLGGMRIASSNVVTGSGLMFYNTGNQNIEVTASAQVNFTAPTNGDYKGVVFYTDRNAPYLTNNIAWGSSTFGWRGAIYMPSQHVSIEGSPVGATPWGLIIGSTVDFSGDGGTVFNNPVAEEIPDITRVTLVQ